jgi:hypothetical protein
MINLEFAVKVCTIIENVAPDYGCHVALTGGCLYKGGERKDIDILFYRIRQAPEINYQGLFLALIELGFSSPIGFGWLYKSKYMGVSLDMFFPESVGDEEYDPTVDYKAAVSAICMARIATPKSMILAPKEIR